MLSDMFFKFTLATDTFYTVIKICNVTNISNILFLVRTIQVTAYIFSNNVQNICLQSICENSHYT